MRRKVSLLTILPAAGLSAPFLLVTLKGFTATYKPELWKLSSADTAVYLLGSIHIGSPEMYPLPKPIEDAFAPSSVLLVEENSSPSDNLSGAARLRG